MPQWPLRDRVEVEWRDSASRGGWRTPDDYKRANAVGPIRSMGYLLTQTKDIVQVAQTQSAMNGDISDVMTIPRENVLRIKRLR